ncbi:MAG: dTDP-4-dehydrorhamnose reductase [Acidaminococcaceae bacterium]
MKILVTGVGGQLGYDVVRELKKRSIDCLGADLKEFDITDYEAAHGFITAYRPDVVIHCSAYTAVDRAEDESELCHRVNATGTENIAKICKEIDAKMIYISTDYVFPGTGEDSSEVDSPTAPQNVYGRTKLEGELAVKKILDKYFIVRISWVFGINGNNFIKTMLKLGKERGALNVVADQIGSPTYTADLAPLLCDMVTTDRYGTYHATNEGVCSWAEFAEEIFKTAKLVCEVNHITTEEYPTKAARPKNSRMSKQSLAAAGFKRLPSWKNAVERYLEELDKADI